MIVLVQVLAVLVIVAGIVFVANQQIMRKVMGFFAGGKRIYGAGAARTVVAVVLFLSASQCRHPVVVTAVGILFLVSGITIFAMGPDKAKQMLFRYRAQSDNVLRLLALVPIAVGGILLLAV